MVVRFGMALGMCVLQQLGLGQGQFQQIWNGWSWNDFL